MELLTGRSLGDAPACARVRRPPCAMIETGGVYDICDCRPAGIVVEHCG
jgi:hypothetical protein